MAVDKKVKGTLVGKDSNAFALMGEFRKLASRQGWTKDEISEVLQAATEGNYDHLVYTLDSYMEE